MIDTFVKTGTVYLTSRSMGNYISNNVGRQSGANDHESSDAAQAALTPML